jgi:UDPglucose 6-dehydrogenase
MTSYRLIVDKSTVPVQTGEWVRKTIQGTRRKNVEFDVASNPEFLREGSAVQDFLHPDRIVVGVESKRAEKILTELYKPLQAPILVTDIKSAELIKHACNSYLAAKISFINLISRICEAVGADVEKVAEGMGHDARIGKSFLNAGIGWGGSCFPKDLSAFIRIAEKHRVDASLLRAVVDINEAQKAGFVEKIQKNLWNLKGKTIGVLGLSFKAGTDDMRSAPSIDIINALVAEGVRVQAYDPEAIPAARALFKEATFVKSAYDAAKAADALVVLTEWPEFLEMDFKRLKKMMNHPVIFDGRNLYERSRVEKAGFEYFGVGR